MQIGTYVERMFKSELSGNIIGNPTFISRIKIYIKGLFNVRAVTQN